MIDQAISNDYQIPFPVYNTKLPNIPKFTKFIIDTDAGGDDAHAILIGLYLIHHYRPEAEIIGITAVQGNANIHNVIKNVNIAIQLSHPEKKPTVYKGCHHDVLRQGYSDNFFGEDGLGGGVQNHYLQKLGLHEKKFEELHHETHAVDFIYQSAKKYGDELCVICLGPLTNIFLTQQLYPDFVKLVGGLTIMGGTYLSIGNTTNACGEFNFMTDVEAASSVVQAPYKHIMIMPFDLVLGMKMNDELVQHIFLNKNGTERGEFVQKMFEKIFAGDVDYYLCDQLTVMLAIMPDLIKRGFERKITICRDGYARGQLIIDWFGKTNGQQEIFIVTGVDIMKAQQYAVEVNHP